MYKIYFYGLGYTKSKFDTIDSALNFLKKQHFEGSVYNHKGEMILTWSPFTGVTNHFKMAA